MPDQPEKPSIHTPLYWAGPIFLAVLPAISVNSASWGMRLGWIGLLIPLLVVGVLAYLQTKDNPELQQRGPYVRRYRPIFAGLVLLAVLLAETLAIAATYATPERTLLWQASKLISELGEAIFPVVGKYATRMEPALQPDILHKVQTVTTLIMLAGFAITLVYIPYAACMPRHERAAMWRATMKKRSSSALLPILVIFAALMGLSLFFGWLEFGHSTSSRLKDCLLEARCYVRDDILIFGSAFLRMFGSFGFWLGAFMLLLRATDEEGI